MTSRNIKKVQIIAEIDDGTHIIAISDNQMLIDEIVSLCQFQRIDETHINEIPLTEIIVK